jgi:hypothetical protein
MQNEGRNVPSTCRVAGGTGEGKGRSIAVSTKEEQMQQDTSQLLDFEKLGLISLEMKLKAYQS